MEPFFYNGPYLGLDESHERGKGGLPIAALVAANGVTQCVVTPGSKGDANLMAFLLAIHIPEVSNGSVPVVYDAPSPMALVLQAARAPPGGG
eukprot:gene2285-6871_t